MEGQNETFPPCRVEAPYPEVRAAGRNPRYAELMLQNMAGSNSEMTAVGLYAYDHLITTDWPEIAELFHRVSIVEMHHLKIFGTLARQLGADPRLWCRQGGRQTWWTPAYLQYSPRLGPLLQIALREEEATARMYKNQARCVHDANIAANLERIAQDERLHAELFRHLLEGYRQRDWLR